MLLPVELQPVGKRKIRLPNGERAYLPVCRPVFRRWSGATISDDYGGKPVLNYRGEACFAELAILRIFEENGWSGIWVDTFRNRFLQSMPKDWSDRSGRVAIPPDKEAILTKIRETAGTKGGCFDLFVWRDSDVLFLELKGPKDSLRAPQRRFIEAALACGITPESLLIAQWVEAAGSEITSEKREAASGLR